MGTASAANQFTIDSHADSNGPIVTDSAGNGYVAWNHKNGGGADTPMFCKLAPGVTSCHHRVALSLPGGTADDSNDTLSLFPILGPGNVVWVVTGRYVRDDVVIWTSTNGGQSFGSPHVIPSGNQCPPGLGTCEDSVGFTDQTGLDDTLPITNSGDTYNRQSYTDGVGQPYVSFVQSSYNPDLAFDVRSTDEVYDFDPGQTEFQFSDPGSGGIAGSTLGTTSTGDVVEAYWLDSTPEKLAFYRFTPTAQRSIFTSGPGGFTGPTVVGNGYLPRLAEGADGLFMLSTDLVHGGTPTAVEIRKYSTSSHTFGAPKRITTTPTGALFDGGGLGENNQTGELAAVSPSFGSSSDMMRLFVSTDGGHSFSPAQDIATVGDEYGGPDNARVAVAGDGDGFVTFQDGRGLEVADLRSLALQYHPKLLGTKVNLPVTCSAPKHNCSIKLTLSLTHFKHSLKISVSLRPGVTRTIKLRLSKPALAFLKSHHYRVGDRLVLSIGSSGARAHTLVLHPKL